MSSPRDEHVDATLRRLAGDETPTDIELAVARSKLDAAILGEQSKRPRTSHYRRPIVAAAMAAIIAVVAGGVLFARPSPLAAALADYAAIVLHTDPLEPAEGEFVLQESEVVALAVVEGSELPAPGDASISYLLVEERAIWVGADGAIEVTTTPTEVRFFSEDAADAYEAANLAELDEIGITRTVRQQGQPLLEAPVDRALFDPEGLERFLREQSRLGGSSLPEDVILYQQLATLLSDPQSQPEIRAAAVLALESVRGIELVESTETRITVALDYTDLAPLRHTLELDVASAQLAANTTQLLEGIEDLGVPASTIISQTTYQPRIITTIGPPSS